MAAALQTVNLTKRFAGLLVTDAVSLSVNAGERRLLLGPNGAGKTTLFNIISGEIRPDAGDIRLSGESILCLPTFERALRGMARTYQILTLFPAHCLWENVAFALLARNRKKKWTLSGSRAWRHDVREQSHDVLRRVGLLASADKRPSEAAYGELRRLEIAMALAQAPSILLLDEPLAGLSEQERIDMQRVIDEVPRTVTILLIEHDLDIALSLVDRVSVLHRGRILVEGERREVVEDPRVKEIYLGQ